MPLDNIVVQGAREHNLKDVSVTIPRNKLVVMTGVSGSGKSSLAFDTIYAEGQRRYVESLSSYARQFLGRMDKPEVDYIEGLSPAISIDQKGVSHNPRSTVGTVTEIYDYLRLLFARAGHPHCYKCGRPVERQTVQQIVDAVLSLPEDSRIQIMAPIVRRRKGEHKEIFEDARKSGFVRVRVNGEVHDLSESFDLDKQKWHDIEVVVDRLVIGASAEQTRVADSVETALKMASGTVLVDVVGGDELLFSEQFACVHCNISMGELEPRTFSFNNPHGACSTCTGLGYKLEVDPDLVLPNKNLSIAEGAVQPWARSGAMSPWYYSQLESLARAFEFSLDVPVKDMKKRDLDRVLYGTKRKAINVQHHTQRGKTYRWRSAFEGVINNLERRHKETESDHVRAEIERYMSSRPCNACKGERLRPEARAVTVCGLNIMDVTNKSIAQASAWVAQIGGDSASIDLQAAGVGAQNGQYAPNGQNGKNGHSPDGYSSDGHGLDVLPAAKAAKASRNGQSKREGKPGRNGKSKSNGRVNIEHPQTLTDREMAIAEQILKEISARLNFLLNIGLDYLTLSRTASTLSGGEAQRIRLATQIGSGLMGVLYVCDEPSIGLHPADDYRLIQTLKRLRDLGNTVLIVEHDEAIMRAADYIVDLGPGAGEHGGHIVATGPVEDIIAEPRSLTGQYLGGTRQIPLPERRREGNGERLVIRGARQNNLKDIDVEIPLGKLVCVTGVSGSGKSTLINEILYKKLAQQFYRARDRAGAVRDIEGVEHIDKVVDIDQSPIGRTPRSNPATYTDTFTPIRELFATVPEARMRGYKPGRFSFNVKGGRCEACTGDGYINIEMQFLPDVTVPCEVCGGKRYNREALEIYWKDANIADVLAMTVSEALEAFENIPRVRRRLQTLQDVGLGYIRLGQPATQLSGGEAQRVKLAKELSKRATGKTLYILDEPTTGLSFEDCAHLLRVLQRLVDTGNTVVLIEHHLDLIKSADWLIDLGPGAGDKGGELIAEGTPETIAQLDHSQTARYLAPLLGITNAAEAVVSAAD
ncbi:MAG: excinuclease ABC subunit UvrA [Chloroflexi bacterium]|nr:excinuclease ABC subunit UvrA [Chloroflexota bacterium]